MNQRSLRIKVAFIILFLSSTCFAQDKTDFEIYFTVLSNQLKEWKVNIDTVKEIVISSKLSLSNDEKSTINSVIDDILKGNDQDLVFYSRNDFKVFEYLKNDSIKRLLEEFKPILDNPFILEKTGFESKSNIELVNFMVIDKIFKGHYWDKEWKKFYKKFPHSHGYYQYSQITKSPEFAVVYQVQRANPLNASGCLLGLRKRNNIWTIIFNLNLWQS